MSTKIVSQNNWEIDKEIATASIRVSAYFLTLFSWNDVFFLGSSISQEKMFLTLWGHYSKEASGHNTEPYMTSKLNTKEDYIRKPRQKEQLSLGS